MKKGLKEQVGGQILLYTSGDYNVKVHVLFSGETVWLTQKQIAELFGVERSVITKHLKKIFCERELEAAAVCAIFAHTAADGKTYDTKFYNLDAIISVGYRVNSTKATQFRIWATQTLREFIIKGFILDDERLKNGKHFGEDYFDELLERIREIRASERRFYQKITDIYAQCSIDYDPQAEATKNFYATVQNNYHVLNNSGTISSEVAKSLAEGEYEKFRVVQDNLYESDFDRVVKEYIGGKKKR